MGKSSSVKRKKKGRPSLLDLQKRKQKEEFEEEFDEEEEEELEELEEEFEEEEEERVVKKRKRRKNLRNSGRRSGRRKNVNPRDEEDSAEEEEDGRRKEKKLRSVLDAAADSPSDNNATRDRGVNSAEIVTHVNNPGSGGATTPLPDKKLLGLLLDRLQKKDTYEVFKEPVDPEELPDYHDIIEHPMDFQTVREKLKNGDYANLEQFESDVLLICSNAMSYNSSDTIYFRQARTIQEMAKKHFSDIRSNSPNPIPRRGRPPSNRAATLVTSQNPSPPSNPAANRVTSQNDPAGGASFNVGARGMTAMDLLGGRPQSFGGADLVRGMMGNYQITNNWFPNYQITNNAGFSGFGSKMGLMQKSAPPKPKPKPIEIEESKRSTYKHPLSYHIYQDPPLLKSFDEFQKSLDPVGIQNEFPYSRSLARFASKLGPIGWKIASERINQVLPPGIPFGPGWVGRSEPAKTLVGNDPSRPATQVTAQEELTADVGESLVVPSKLNVDFRMNGCGSLNGFNIINNNMIGGNGGINNNISNMIGGNNMINNNMIGGNMMGGNNNSINNNISNMIGGNNNSINNNISNMIGGNNNSINNNMSNMIGGNGGIYNNISNMIGGNNSIISNMIGGNNSIISNMIGGNNSIISNMIGGNNSIISNMIGGNNMINDNISNMIGSNNSSNNNISSMIGGNNSINNNISNMIGGNGGINNMISGNGGINNNIFLRNGELGLNLNLGFESMSGLETRVVERKQQHDLALHLKI